MVRERDPQPRVLVYSSKIWSAAVALFLGALGAAAGWAFLGSTTGAGAVGPGELALGLLPLLLPACAAHSARALLGRPVLVIDERGITNRSTMTGPRFLAWSQIRSVHVDRYGTGGRQIAVAVRDGARMRAGPLTRLNRLLGDADMYIPTLRLPLTSEEALDEIAAFAPEDVLVGGRRRLR